MRRTVAVCLACLVVLAGCGTGGSGGATDPETVTPAPVPSDAATEVPSERTVAPGVTTGGVVAPTRLVGAHVAALRGRSFKTTRRTVEYAPDGTVRASVQIRGFVSADRRRLYLDRRAEGTVVESTGLDGRTEQYMAGTRVAEREVRNGTERFDSRRRDPGAIVGTVLISDLLASSTYSLAFHGMNFTVASQPDRWSAAQYRLVSTGTPSRDTVVGLAGGRARNLSFMATVTDDGLVTWSRLAYTAERGGETVRVVRTVSFEEVGTTSVERPAWFETATNESTVTRTTPETQTAPARGDPPRPSFGAVSRDLWFSVPPAHRAVRT
ncbi:hypothetical protein [Halomarina oriensis]|uniref:Uncharacterized protein n=1 Tax=Halomarina oriensis TaxID=671145 RepID=A0A6B0GI12_9EURY|nr:hypothetical protein [Halomarina oriensis]MWG34502.1 hypothetical protein [Halomarina oriensis]